MTTAAFRFVGQAHTARSLALLVLIECEQGEAFVQEILDQHLRAAKLSTLDRRLATHIVYGVLRRQGTLDALLKPLVARPLKNVESWLWNTLRIGAYQLAVLSYIPPHAAIHETVELATEFQRPSAKGFLNGILRSLSRRLSIDTTSAPAANAIPIDSGRYRCASEPVFADPSVSPAKYLAEGFSLTPWLAERWLARYSWDECVRLGFWFAGPAPMWLRCNPLRTSRSGFLATLQTAGIAAEAGSEPFSIQLTETAAVRELPGFDDGCFVVQDESAQKAAAALAPAPRSRVLDMCAAPGGKATHLAELMNNQGRVLACDVDDGRLRTINELCNRLGITIVETVRVHPEHNPPAGPFDSILVDVPCSNTGVLGRRPEVRWRLQSRDLQNLVPLQTKLLLQAAERIRAGGALVYSTCSIEQEENRNVVDAVLRAMPQLVLEADEQLVPGQPADGGYWARLRRKGG